MIEDRAAYVGVDWATTAHQVCVLDADGAVLGERSFPHSGEGLLELADWVRQTAAVDPHRIAVGIEVPHGPVVEGLMDAGFRVHALNPKQLDRLRDRFTVAGAKDDRRDAYVLADALRTDARFYRHLEPLHPIVVELREWARIAQDLAAERNRLANRFRHQLWAITPISSSCPTTGRNAASSTCGSSRPRPPRRAGCARARSPHFCDGPG